MRSLGSQPAGECVSAKGPKDTFDGSAEDKSPCEIDVNEGLVVGRVKGRIGVHVQSEVVLKCEGNNQRGLVRHAVLDVKNDCFVRHVDSMTQVLSYTRKITCAGMRRMRGFGVVFTHTHITPVVILQHRPY